MEQKKEWVYPNASEIPVILAAVKGDQDSFDAIYRLHLPRVRSVCASILRDPMVVEEIIQDVFLRVHRKLYTFQFRASLSTWITRIAITEALQRRRKIRSRDAREVSLEVLLGQSKTASDKSIGVAVQRRNDTQGHFSEPWKVDHKVESLVERQALRIALGLIKGTAKRVFVMKEVHGHSNAKISKRLGISVPSVKSYFFRARSIMRESLQQSGYKYGKTRPTKADLGSVQHGLEKNQPLVQPVS